ncbi:MAG: hypothetical protein AAF677_11205 [Pseudomonadota bacterium]
MEMQAYWALDETARMEARLNALARIAMTAPNGAIIGGAIVGGAVVGGAMVGGAVVDGRAVGGAGPADGTADGTARERAAERDAQDQDRAMGMAEPRADFDREDER